ncbi:hypothetical protein BTA51_13695 [Hahella sp. CCB-MM4]|uniref:FecR domain-containing protein n=1 Tax=Hahella sp. (strain CCB-MM4) TaxID=1926491 RepID=UPI000B9ADF6E|nr:FecR domain-containing protein [Hahella sp. CCB-MM4]OZG73003.1 hypothetical protein BTA51_13695 [Hahella sp. CCB-MM4]
MGVLLRDHLLFRKRSSRSFTGVVFWGFLFLLPGPAFASPPCSQWMGKVIAVDGTLELSHPNQSWSRLQAGQYVCPGDVLRTGINSRASIYLSNNTYMRLNQVTLVHFPDSPKNESFWIQLQSGIAHFLSRITHRFEVETPYVNAMVEGTEFVVSASQQGSVTVIEGRLLTSAGSRQLSIGQGEMAQISPSDKSLQAIRIDSTQSVDWAVYFPPLITLEELISKSSDDREQSILRQSYDLINSRETDAALSLLEAQPDQSPAIRLTRAAIQLSLGQSEEAESSLIALQNDPELAPQALSLQAILEVIRSQPDAALDAARSASRLAPESAAAHLAMSYAWQAKLQLENATTSAEQATVMAPDNILGWTRLAELYLSSASYGKARHATEQAQALAPHHPLVLTMAGYVALFDLDLSQSKQLFQQALEKDPGNPSTWLGLGLALLRSGDTEQGRHHLEIAVSLSPNQSLLRSYLGRSYFEEKRGSDAEEQWQLAEKFDPNDPTPMFYLGIHKLFNNDPVGAIEDLQHSKSLNEHRAIYRSDGLLQSDAASRSAALARAYDEVGYDQAVLLEGWKALRQDPASPDGHRLLADRYATLPNHEAARASELLQAQLWQPLSVYPFQPQLSETGLSVIEGLGPSLPGHNEYHSLFSQNGLYAWVNGIAGSDDTWGNDAVISALEGPLAISLGQYHYQTDGFRGQDTEQEQDIYNGLLQWQVLPSTSIQLEARKLDSEDQIYTLKSIAPDADIKPREINEETYRLGFRSRLNQQHSIIFSAISQNRDDNQSASSTVTNRTQKTIEVQHLYNQEDFYLQTGLGNSEIEGDAKIGNPGDYFQLEETEDLTHKHFYTYLGYRFSEQLFLLLGAAYDNQETTPQQTIKFYDIPLPTENAPDKLSEWSPKFGLEYSPVNEITMRLAAFKTIKRDIAADQTIEPVQVVGFNQVYDDINSAEVKVYAVGLDYVPDSGNHLGLESIFRKVNTPIEAFQEEPDQNQREFNYHRIYFYHSFSDRMTMDLGHEFEDIDLVDKQFTANGNIYRTKTFITPVGVNYYLHQTLYGRIESIYADQTVDASFFSDDQREFREHLWNLNLQIGFRFPKRLGELQLGINNLTDEDNEIINSELDYPRFYPKRFLYSRIQLSF